MVDVFDKAKRSEVMSRIRGRGNRNTELALAKLMRRHGITGWRRHQSIPGRPDFIFRAVRLAVFVDGCFWHGCPRHCQMPATNRAFWYRKLRANKARDHKINRELRGRGWRVLRVWEHEMNKPERVLGRLRAALGFGAHHTQVLTASGRPRAGAGDLSMASGEPGDAERRQTVSLPTTDGQGT